MTARVWGWVALGVAGLILGGFLLTKQDWHSSMPVLGGIVALIGLGVLVYAGLTRRTRLVADAEGFTFKNWRGSQRIAWNRLSSLQFKRESQAIVVVNDMGRSQMEIPVHLFDRKALHEWLGTIPARTPGRSNLLG